VATDHLIWFKLSYYQSVRKPQQSSMADDTPRTLVCLIEGISVVFKIMPTGGMNIMDLKNLVKEKGKNSMFSDVDAYDLTLWKVGISMASDSTTDSFCRFIFHSFPKISESTSLVKTCQAQ
jgi:hypothetical protein